MLTISKNLVWPRELESFKGGNFNTLSLVDCYVQICNGTAVEHGSPCFIYKNFMPVCHDDVGQYSSRRGVLQNIR
jgi:hypothetical protein